MRHKNLDCATAAERAHRILISSETRLSNHCCTGKPPDRDRRDGPVASKRLRGRSWAIGLECQKLSTARLSRHGEGKGSAPFRADELFKTPVTGTAAQLKGRRRVDAAPVIETPAQPTRGDALARWGRFAWQIEAEADFSASLFASGSVQEPANVCKPVGNWPLRARRLATQLHATATGALGSGDAPERRNRPTDLPLPDICWRPASAHGCNQHGLVRLSRRTPRTLPSCKR